MQPQGTPKASEIWVRVPRSMGTCQSSWHTASVERVTMRLHHQWGQHGQPPRSSTKEWSRWAIVWGIAHSPLHPDTISGSSGRWKTRIVSPQRGTMMGSCDVNWLSFNSEFSNFLKKTFNQKILSVFEVVESSVDFKDGCTLLVHLTWDCIWSIKPTAWRWMR